MLKLAPALLRIPPTAIASPTPTREPVSLPSRPIVRATAMLTLAPASLHILLSATVPRTRTPELVFLSMNPIATARATPTLAPASLHTPLIATASATRTRRPVQVQNPTIVGAPAMLVRGHVQDGQSPVRAKSWMQLAASGPPWT